MRGDVDWLRGLIRDIPDHPQPGVVFRDITPMLREPKAFRTAVDAIAEHYDFSGISHVVGIEARGFIVAAPVAHQLRAGFVPVRKPGKLPWRTDREAYALEYGDDALELHVDAFRPGDRVLIVDDVLATGGTAAATVRLVERSGASVVGLGFLIELAFLNGRSRLVDRDIQALLTY